MGIRWITDEGIRNKYKGGKISIIGTGPSLDDYPKDFFDDKIAIGLNWAFLGFPKAFEDTNEDTYILAADGKMAKWVTANRPGLLRRYIYPLPITMQGRMGYFGRLKDLPIRLAWDREISEGGASREEFTKSVKDLMEKGICRGVTTITGLGNAIFAAVALGAKRIELSGCDAIIGYHLANDERHAQRGGIAEAYRTFHNEKLWNEFAVCRQEQTLKNYGKFRQGTSWLAELLRPHGIELVYCFYPTAQKLIPEDRSQEAARKRWKGEYDRA